MYKITGQDTEYDIEKGTVGYVVNGQWLAPEINKTGEREWLVFDGNKSIKVLLLSEAGTGLPMSFLINGNQYTVTAKDPADIALEKLGLTRKDGSGTGVLRAPMPGLITEILVSKGDEVEKGAPLVVLEAMKMENVLKADHPGQVKEVLAGRGNSVEKGEVLLRF